jgi:hypothetical protein
LKLNGTEATKQDIIANFGPLQTVARIVQMRRLTGRCAHVAVKRYHVDVAMPANVIAVWHPIIFQPK